MSTAEQKAKRAAYMRRWVSLNPEKRKLHNDASYKKHRVQRIKSMREWAKKNRLKRNKYAREWDQKRRDADVGYRAGKNIRHRIWSALSGGNKSFPSFKLIGCSVEHLRTWLTFYFQPGMSWKNYGQWHIDHIRPCASFDLSDPAKQRQCFHYTNLQPLWAKENLSKGAKRGIS